MLIVSKGCVGKGYFVVPYLVYYTILFSQAHSKTTMRQPQLIFRQQVGSYREC